MSYAMFFHPEQKAKPAMPKQALQTDDAFHPAPSGWDKSALRKFRDGQDDARKAQDAAQLSRVFNLTAKSKSVKEALDWAAANDIDIVVDRTSRNVGGYYMNGTGVVALSAPAFWSDSRLAGVVVHEIRHAWQDKQKLISTAEYRLDHYIIKNALIEADATAHQRLAEQEIRVFETGETVKRVEKMGQYTGWAKKVHETEVQLIADPAAYLLAQFRGWYQSSLPSLYGRAATQRFARQYGMRDVKVPDWNIEMTSGKTPTDIGVDFLHRRALRKLGERYDGSNYFKSANLKRVKAEQLSPARARTFFSRAAANDAALVKEVVKCERAEVKATGTRRLVNPWTP